jgi:hypothetical protein
MFTVFFHNSFLDYIYGDYIGNNVRKLKVLCLHAKVERRVTVAVGDIALADPSEVTGRPTALEPLRRPEAVLAEDRE